jgi:hypothetical protein
MPGIMRDLVSVVGFSPPHKPSIPLTASRHRVHRSAVLVRLVWLHSQEGESAYPRLHDGNERGGEFLRLVHIAPQWRTSRSRAWSGDSQLRCISSNFQCQRECRPLIFCRSSPPDESLAPTAGTCATYSGARGHCLYIGTRVPSLPCQRSSALVCLG